MKRFFLITILILITNITKAQEANTKIGGGLSYVSNISSPGLFFKGIFPINNTMEMETEFSYFFARLYNSG